jgi:hypothetical protein
MVYQQIPQKKVTFIKKLPYYETNSKQKTINNNYVANGV